MSEEIGLRLDAALDHVSYEVVLNDRGRIRWIDRSGDEEVWLDSEPQAGFWRHFSAGFMRILPIKNQL